MLSEPLKIDGRLSEPSWSTAKPADTFVQTDPVEGAPATARTVVRVLADAKTLAIGIVCDDPDPSKVVSFSVRRDAPLTSEDHVRVVIGPFLDGRSGYVFAVNASGARYDGLINPGGDSDNPDWDGIWQAAAVRTDSGWSVEISIPVQTLSFQTGQREWHFNVQRRIQRLETDRWAFPSRQYRGRRRLGPPRNSWLATLAFPSRSPSTRARVRRIQSSWPMNQHFNDSRRNRKDTCGI